MGLEKELAAHGRASGLHWRELIALLVLGDAAIALVFLFATVRVWSVLDPEFTPTELFEAWFVATAAVWLVALRIGGGYGLVPSRSGVRHAGPLLRALAIVAAVTLVAYFFVPRAFPRSTSLVALPVVFAALLGWRELIATRMTRWTALERRVLLLGVDEATTRLAALIGAPSRAVPYRPVAFLTDSPRPSQIGGVPVLAGTDGVWEHVRRLRVAEIAIARGEALAPACIERLVECFQSGVAVIDAAELYEELSGRVLMSDIGPQWYAQLPTLPRRPYFALKRAFDVAGAAILLVVLSPLLLVIGSLVLALDGRPVLYTQRRLGRRSEPFTIHKFRSMRNDAEHDGPRYADPSDARSTSLGRFLRPTGLDELPQLWDVLRGRMSLIGPRPERPELAARLAAQLPLYWARALVRPGIVGWAELNVPYATTTEQHLERLEYDIYYIKRADLLLDLDIGLRAVGLVLRGRR